MQKFRFIFALRIIGFLLAGILLAGHQGRTQTPASGSEQTLWNLEHDYFKYVEANDLKGYLKLWHKSFLGWPSVSAAPVHKDHITDWITDQTSQGRTFKLIELKPAAIQVTGDIGVTCYWITYRYQEKSGKSGSTNTLRITHTWLKEGENWYIIGGMSMPEHEDRKD